MSLKTFKDMVNHLAEAARDKSFVFDKKLKGIRVQISKVGTQFKVFIDGDELDTYRSQKEAEKTANDFVKQYKG